jgi:hypothetical protein
MLTAGVVRRLQIVTLVVLFVVLVLNVWRVGVMHTDDAIWILGAQRSQFELAWQWAISQGRLFAAVVGTFMLHALRYEGTLYAELLKFGSFAAFLVSWALVLWKYWGRRLALLAVALFLGWHALRFEGSALVTYPLLVWPTGTAIAGAILAGHRYATKGDEKWLAVSAAALFFGLFTNEALTVTFAALTGFAWAANCWLRLDASPRSGRWQLTGRDTRLGATILLTIAVYAALAIGFALLHPSQYPGHTLAPFDALRISSVLANFSTSGSVLHDLVRPYWVVYADQITASGFRIVYGLPDAFRGLAGALPEILLGIATGILVWTLVKPSEISMSEQHDDKLPAWTAIAPGLCLALGPIFPVALTERYQNWHMELGVMAYVTSIVCHFGYSIVIASLMLSAEDKFRDAGGTIWFAALFSVVAGLLAFIGIRTNERIAFDMRPEGARWAVFGRALPFMSVAGLDAKRILAPQFSSGSWFSVVPETYWSDYASVRFGRPLIVKYRNITPQELAVGTDILTYAMSDDRRSFDLIAAHVRSGGENAGAVERIAVELGDRTESASASAVLSYVDRQKGPQQIHVGKLPYLGAGRYVLSGVDAIPGTLHLAHETTAPALSVTCGSTIARGTIVTFGTESAAGRGEHCAGGAMLTSGWSLPESSGARTNTPTAVLTLPAGLLTGASRLTLDLSATSPNDNAGEQKAVISVPGSAPREVIFGNGRPSPRITLSLTPVSGTPARISIDIVQPAAPNGGVLLRSMRVD